MHGAHGPLGVVLVGLVLTTMALVGSARLAACVRFAALQGAMLGVLTILAHPGADLLRPALLAVANVGIKGFVFPWLLTRAMRDANVRREAEPLVGYGSSLLVALVLLGVCLWISDRLVHPNLEALPLSVAAALFMVLMGLFQIVARRTALSQVLGYLVMDNGVYAFGVGVAGVTPGLVELGILLDLLVAVFVMGIAMFHISREFDHIDTDRLTTLRDWQP